VDCSRLADTVIAMLAEQAGDAVVGESELLSPLELEEGEGWPEGQPHHAELALDQALWMRPLPELHASRRRRRRGVRFQLCSGDSSALSC
jgi:phytoene dehydrogenase-like protein